LGPEMRDRHPSMREFQIPTEGEAGQPDIGHLILCSDGLWHYLDHPRHLESLIYTNDTLQALPISRGLVDFACNRGGRDNVTVATWSL
jgi:PPM family protein phosphatase